MITTSRRPRRRRAARATRPASSTRATSFRFGSPSRSTIMARSRRSSAAASVADKLVYAHEALHLREKLQSASYVQTVEKWDTDSDSNESDDEEDLKR